MKKTKSDNRKTGIWLDHAVAHFIRVKKGRVVVESIHSEAETEVRFKGETGTGTKLSRTRSTNKEHNKHLREQKILNKYYKQLAEKIAGYNTVYLFGPSTAKSELLNRIRADKKTVDKTFVVSSAPEMTFNQMVARVKEVLGTE